MAYKVSLLCISTLLMIAGNTLPASATPTIGTLKGMVINVQNGDHLTITNDGTEIEARLYGVRAPVMAKNDNSLSGVPQASQPCSERAFMALTKKVLHKEVMVEIKHISRHGRTVAVIWVDGRDVNREMVDEGWAWASLKNKDKNESYIQAEKDARYKRLGLWSQENPEPPWEFKKKAKMRVKGTSKVW